MWYGAPGLLLGKIHFKLHRIITQPQSRKTLSNYLKINFDYIFRFPESFTSNDSGVNMLCDFEQNILAPQFFVS